MVKQRTQWGLLVGIVLLVLMIALPTLTYPLGRDQGMYANIGRSILDGGTPFVDIWDIKPPPIYYIYATTIAIFGTSTEAIHAMNLLFVPIGMVGLFVIGRQIQDYRVGLWAALLYGVFYFNDGFQNISQSDSLATIPTIFAACFTIRATQAKQGSPSALGNAFIVGLICGILLWFKPQQYALIVSALIIYQIMGRWRESLPAQEKLMALLKEGTAFALGGLLTGGTLLLYFWSQGIIQEILIVADATASYNAQGYDLNAFIGNMRQGLVFRWGVWHILFLLMAGWLVIQIMTYRQSSSHRLKETTLLLLWVTAGLGFAFVQAKGFDTHWFPMLPPMALMGALMIVYLLDAIPSSKRVMSLSAIIALGLLAIPAMTTWGHAWGLITQHQDRYTYWDTFQANDLKPEQSLAMAQFLQERVQAGDSLYIWGFRPEVYYMAQLRPATRYQAHFPLVAPWYPQEWQQNNVDILWAAMPPYALVLEDDFMPWVTDFDADSHTLLQDYTELNNWLIANYEREGQIGDFIIWRRATP